MNAPPMRDTGAAWARRTHGTHVDVSGIDRKAIPAGTQAPSQRTPISGRAVGPDTDKRPINGGSGLLLAEFGGYQTDRFVSLADVERRQMAAWRASSKRERAAVASAERAFNAMLHRSATQSIPCSK